MLECRYWNFDGDKKTAYFKPCSFKKALKKLSKIDPRWDEIIYIFNTETRKLLE